MERTIDFAALQRINPEIVGWLYVPQIGVDSPILTGQTDTEYLTKDFEGHTAHWGVFFTFAGARLSDSQVYLFAHNMASGQMFGSLKQFTNDAFLAANPPRPICIHRSVSGNCRWKTGRICRRMIPAFQSGKSGDCQSHACDLCGIFQTPKRLAVNTKVVEERTAF